MTDLRDHDPLVEAVAKARARVSARPDIKFPLGTLNMINGHVYAYSGALTFDNVATTLLEFVTQAETLEVDFIYMRNDTDSLDSKHRMFFDDVLVLSFPLSSGGQDRQAGTQAIIPPFTKVSITVQNVSNTSGGSGMVALSGEVV